MTTTMVKTIMHVARPSPEEPLTCTPRPSSPWTLHAELLSSSLGQGGKEEDLETSLLEAARGMKAEGLQCSGTGNGQDTVNARFLVQDQEELGFIFHVWDVARGQGALNPSGVRSPRLGHSRGEKTTMCPSSTAAPPRAGASLPARRAPLAKDSATTPRDERRGPTDSMVASRCQQFNKLQPSGWGLPAKGPRARSGAGGFAPPGSPARGSKYKGWAPPALADARPLRCPRCTPVPVPAAGCYSN